MTGRMTTEELIDALAARPAPPPLNRLAVGLALTGAVVAGLSVFWAVFGFRPDLARALVTPVTLAKTVLPLALSVTALLLALRSARPEVRLPLWPLLLPAGLAAVLFLRTAMGTPPEQFLPGLMGQTALACTLSVTGLALAPVLLGTSLLRRGASTRPALSGALIGLASGAGATAGYALHCTEDSPLFFVTWYGLAIVLATALGAVIGARRLRW